MSRRRLGLVLACLPAWAGVTGACAYRPGHPVLRGPWGLGGPRGAEASPGGVAEPGDPSEREGPTPQRIDAFFGDMGNLRLRLREMREKASALDQPITRFSDREAAAGLMRRLGGRGPLGGALRNAVVYGISARLPITAQKAGWLWFREEAQGRALGMQAFRREGYAYDLPQGSRLAYRAELLGVGTKPFTFDLVFGMWIEGLDLPDGTVLLRYDPRPVAGQRHVTLWRGGVIIEPDGAGCVLTEVLVFGTDIRVPLLESMLRGQIEQALASRGLNLWGFAYQLAGRAVPRAR